jgi:murein DD-endopeptidase MepM/ murein hydrolase activator NlpD
MPSSRPDRRRRVERPRARAARRARRVALLVLLSAVFLVALGLTAFGGTTTRTAAIIPRQSLSTVAQTRPTTEIVALRGPVRLQLPISQSRLTAIGYHAAGDGGLSLQPVGHQANEGLVQRVIHGVFGGGGGAPRWYQLGGGGTSAIDVGAPVGSDVYSPVDGTVVAIRPFVVEGKSYGSEIDIQPQTAPSLIVAVTQLVADPALTVGTAVVSGATKLGRVANLAAIERQALARYTNDAGNHVTVEVRSAPVLTTG